MNASFSINNNVFGGDANKYCMNIFYKTNYCATA